MLGDAAVAFLRSASDGTRVVIRYTFGTGATDALGYLSGTSPVACVVATTRGLVTVQFADVIAAKEVPPPPAPRTRRVSGD
jgi:hypothetical protein